MIKILSPEEIQKLRAQELRTRKALFYCTCMYCHRTIPAQKDATCPDCRKRERNEWDAWELKNCVCPNWEV